MSESGMSGRLRSERHWSAWVGWFMVLVVSLYSISGVLVPSLMGAESLAESESWFTYRRLGSAALWPVFGVGAVLSMIGVLLPRSPWLMALVMAPWLLAIGALVVNRLIGGGS